MKDSTVWRNAFNVAQNNKVSTRIDYWKSVRITESKRQLSWTLSRAEETLLRIIDKNTKDLLRCEENNEPVPPTVNNGLISATKALNEMLEKREQDDLEQRKKIAEVENIEKKNKLMDNDTKDGEQLNIILNL